MKIDQSKLQLLAFLRLGGLNNYLRGWDRFIRSLFPLEDQSYDLVETIYRGRRYAASPRHYVDWQVLTTGAYEHDDLTILERLIRQIENPVILDIGTNVGHHAFFFASLGAKVHAFEPNPELWSIVEAKISVAGLTGIILHKFGLASHDEILRFHIPDASNSGTGQFLGEQSVAASVVANLPVRNGDTFLSEEGVSKVDLLKIDVQGFESEVLRGLGHALALHRPVVAVEIGEDNRGDFPTVSALRSMLPDDYGFLMCTYTNIGPVRVRRLGAPASDSFGAWEGNLFCLPLESKSWAELGK